MRRQRRNIGGRRNGRRNMSVGRNTAGVGSGFQMPPNPSNEWLFCFSELVWDYGFSYNAAARICGDWRAPAPKTRQYDAIVKRGGGTSNPIRNKNRINSSRQPCPPGCHPCGNEWGETQDSWQTVCCRECPNGSVTSCHNACTEQNRYYPPVGGPKSFRRGGRMFRRGGQVGAKINKGKR